jgi:retron-type reverse transcriptase
MQSKLNLIAEKAKQNPNMKFTALIHHTNAENLLQGYSEMKRNKACGIEVVTFEEYGINLNENIKLLVKKLITKEYRHKPVRRVYIHKPGKEEKRALGIALENKLVQLMAKKILEPIFEPKFLECFHGFRPGLSCHTAIGALNHTTMKKPVNHVVEVDIRKFLDWNPLPKIQIYYQMYNTTPLSCGNVTLKSPLWESYKQGSEGFHNNKIKFN